MNTLLDQSAHCLFTSLSFQSLASSWQTLTNDSSQRLWTEVRFWPWHASAHINVMDLKEISSCLEKSLEDEPLHSLAYLAEPLRNIVLATARTAQVFDRDRNGVLRVFGDVSVQDFLGLGGFFMFLY